jgi:hypothetical protein
VTERARSPFGTAPSGAAVPSVSEGLTVTELDTAAVLARTLNELTPTQLRDLAEGRGRLVFAPCATPRRRPATAPGSDLSADVAAIGAMTTPAEVHGHLDDRRFTVPMLRALARALGPTVPGSGRNRAELVHGIVEGTVGFRARSAALSGGAWSR